VSEAKDWRAFYRAGDCKKYDTRDYSFEVAVRCYFIILL